MDTSKGNTINWTLDKLKKFTRIKFMVIEIKSIKKFAVLLIKLAFIPFFFAIRVIYKIKKQ